MNFFSALPSLLIKSAVALLIVFGLVATLAIGELLITKRPPDEVLLEAMKTERSLTQLRHRMREQGYSMSQAVWQLHMKYFCQRHGISWAWRDRPVNGSWVKDALLILPRETDRH